jgi:hypothetical protein
MTTNMTKLAEAIGIISSVLSDEVAQSQHFVDVDDDDTVDVDEYNELKEIITDGIPDVLTDIETIKAEIDAACNAALEVEPWSIGDDDQVVDEQADTETESTEVNSDDSNEEKSDVSVDDLLNINKNLIATLDMVDEQLNELTISVESLQDQVEEH